MKTLVQIQPAPFEVISQEYDNDMSPERAVEAYRELQAAFKPKEGIPEKDFNDFLDRQLMGGTNHVEEYQLMSPGQQGIVQAVKRSLKRIEAKQNKHE